MIHEVIVTTKDSKDKIHIAPMGIRWLNDNHNSKKIIISPFKPSTTLDNLMITNKAVINFIDDVRVFAGIVTKKKRDWDVNTSNDEYPYLDNTNTYIPVNVVEIIEDKNENLKNRPPIIRVQGHVDQGKTAVLDVLRSTNVVSGEFGGITQHIGAYQIENQSNKLTFIDTKRKFS